MLRRILLVVLMLVVDSQAFSSEHTFLLYEMHNQKLVTSEGKVDEASSPMSTFKIPLSLMGFESGVFQDQASPVWEYKPERHDRHDIREVEKKPHTPESWIKYSVIWYSQDLTRTMGQQQFQTYVDTLGYGNRDLSGDPGQNNGLTNSWLGSSLKISPSDQLEFLRKLVNNKLPFGDHAQQMTRLILNLGTFENGWNLHGKTGSGTHINEDGTKDFTKTQGWFIGWLTKDDKQVIFVYRTQGLDTKDGAGGPQTKAFALDRLRLYVEENGNHQGV